jgi:hypothetical protein
MIPLKVMRMIDIVKSNKQKYFKWSTPLVMVFLMIFLVSCTQSNNAPIVTSGLEPLTPIDNQTQTSNPEQNPETITLTGMPDSAEAGQDFTIKWSIQGDAATTENTAIVYGPLSIPNPTGQSDYPQITRNSCDTSSCSLPTTFSANINITNPGNYYYRAHAIVNSLDVWSSEASIIITPQTQMQQTQSVQEYTLGADDYGFYLTDNKITSLSVSTGNPLKLTFDVNPTNVYYGGLQIKGCGQDTGKIVPGGTAVIEFTPTANCRITSYWPASGVVKSNIDLKIQ